MHVLSMRTHRIMTLANIDPRVLGALRGIRNGNFSYERGISVPQDLVTSLSKDLGYPPSWGDPALLPAYGGPQANETWKALGVSSRPGRGGLPCEIVHGDVTGASCFANAAIRGAQAFAEAIAIYLPVSSCLRIYRGAEADDTIIGTRLTDPTHSSKEVTASFAPNRNVALCRP